MAPSSRAQIRHPLCNGKSLGKISKKATGMNILVFLTFAFVCSRFNWQSYEYRQSGTLAGKRRDDGVTSYQFRKVHPATREKLRAEQIRQKSSLSPVEPTKNLEKQGENCPNEPRNQSECPIKPTKPVRGGAVRGVSEHPTAVLRPIFHHSTSGIGKLEVNMQLPKVGK